MKKKIFLLIIFVLVLGFIINLPSPYFTPEKIQYVRVAGQSVHVDLAISPEAHERGLSDRASLPEGEGILFVFDRPGKNMFWMKDMNFPIDIIWISDNLAVIHIEKNIAPGTYPEMFGPDAYSKYVLEVPAGFAEKSGLKLGDQVLFAE